MEHSKPKRLGKFIGEVPLQGVPAPATQQPRTQVQKVMRSRVPLPKNPLPKRDGAFVIDPGVLPKPPTGPQQAQPTPPVQQPSQASQQSQQPQELQGGVGDKDHPKASMTDDAVETNAGQIEYLGQDIAREVEDVQREHPGEPIVVINAGDSVKEVRPLTEAIREIYKIKSTFPFDLFPDELIIEEKRIVINIREMFWSGTIDTIPIASLKLFEITRSIFFSSLHIVGEGGTDVIIKWLKPQEAQKVKEIVDGLFLREKGLIEVKEEDPNKQVEIFKKIGESTATI